MGSDRTCKIFLTWGFIIEISPVSRRISIGDGDKGVYF